LARFLYTAVSVWLRLTPSGGSGPLLVGWGGGAWAGGELDAGEEPGAAVAGTGAVCKTGVGTDVGLGSEAGFKILVGTGISFGAARGSDFDPLTGARGAGGRGKERCADGLYVKVCAGGGSGSGDLTNGDESVKRTPSCWSACSRGRCW